MYISIYSTELAQILIIMYDENQSSNLDSNGSHEGNRANLSLPVVKEFVLPTSSSLNDSCALHPLFFTSTLMTTSTLTTTIAAHSWLNKLVVVAFA